MEIKNLRESVKSIRMTEEMKQRIISKAVGGEGTPVKKIIRIKPILAAAAISVCVCMTAALAAERMGFFRDVKNWNGAVVGTAYERAAEEITVRAAVAGASLTVTAVMAEPDEIPYRELDSLGIDSYKIIDPSGGVIVEGGRTELFEITGEKTEISLPVDSLAGGNYKLVITAFVGGSKADQPLVITGGWECDFSL